MLITKVLDKGDIFIVNNSLGVIKNSGSPVLGLIQAWIAEGNTPEVYQEPELTYVELRIADYPTIAEQLDMQYWDSVNGTTVWFDTIQAIKDKYPKT